MSTGVLFDPGFAPHVSIFSGNIEYMYQNLEKFKNFNQKKFQFKTFYPQVIKFLDNHIAFYLGCLLWASVIKAQGNLPILEHPCLGEAYDEEISLFEVNYIQDFIQKLAKDSKYYLGIEFKFDDKKQKILDMYKEFLSKNKAFVDVKTTDDIKLPENFPKFDELDKINEKIQDVVNTGRLEELFIFCDKI